MIFRHKTLVFPNRQLYTSADLHSNKPQLQIFVCSFKAVPLKATYILFPGTFFFIFSVVLEYKPMIATDITILFLWSYSCLVLH